MNFSDMLKGFAAGYAANNLIRDFKNRRKPVRQGTAKPKYSYAGTAYDPTSTGYQMTDAARFALEAAQPFDAGMFSGPADVPANTPSYNRPAGYRPPKVQQLPYYGDSPNYSSATTLPYSLSSDPYSGAITLPYSDAGRMDFRQYDLPPPTTPDAKVEAKVDEASSEDLILLSELLAPYAAARAVGLFDGGTPSSSPAPRSGPRTPFSAGQPRFQPASPRYNPTAGPSTLDRLKSRAATASSPGMWERISPRLAAMLENPWVQRLGGYGRFLAGGAAAPYLLTGLGTYTALDYLDPRSEKDKEKYWYADWGPEELGP